MAFPKQQLDELAKEACWEAAEWSCDGNCHKCTTGHWKHYKRLSQKIVEKWERIKNERD